MAWEDLRRTYISILSADGFRPEVDKEGDIHFKYEGGHYYITDDCDDRYFHILYPGFWGIDTGDELVSAIVAANAATRRVKVAKVWVNSSGKTVSAATECFVSKPADVASILTRALGAIQRAVEVFREELKT